MIGTGQIKLTKTPINGMYTLISAKRMATADNMPPSTIGCTRVVLISSPHLFQYQKEFAQEDQFPANTISQLLV